MLSKTLMIILGLVVNFLPILNHTEKDENPDISKLKYLPEFNIDSVHYAKWSKYYNQIQDAHRNFSQTKLPEALPDLSVDTYCNVFSPLIKSDLRYFEEMFGRNFITKEVVDKMVASKRGVHYQIIKGRLYREEQCMFPSRCQGIEHFLLEIISKLPNMDLVINVRDYPQVGKYFEESQQYPIFSFSKEASKYADITYPAWTFWSGGPALDIYPSGIGRWDLMRDSLLKKQSQIPWSKKQPVAFFRGSRTSAQRDPIVFLSRSRPDLVDARYTKNQAWKSKEDTLGDEPSPTVSFEEHCQYKYLFNAHGVAASFRLKHLFLCRSLVLNVESDWIEFFYPPLKPWIHYVPISKDFTHAIDVLNFLHQNDQIAARIAKRGFEFIRDHLTMRSVRCYWHQLLLSYATQLLEYQPNESSPDLVEIQP